jgi:hypothetical protein
MRFQCDLAIPDSYAPTISGHTMQAVGAIVGGQLVGLPVQAELSVGNAVGHPANY